YEGLARVAGLTGEARAGAVLLGGAAALRQMVGAAQSSAERRRWSRTESALRRALGGGAFDAAYGAGRVRALNGTSPRLELETEAMTATASTSTAARAPLTVRER